MKIEEKKPAEPQAAIQTIPIDQLEPNPNNPRRTWSTDKDDAGHTSLQRLAESIREQGILQPLVVAPHEGKYWIICGERRYRASKEFTDLKALPCVVRTDLDEKTSLEVSLTENLQREDLSPMDTAHAYNELITKCGYTARAIAKKLGVSPAAISQRLSLLKLTPELQADVHQGKLSESQGTAIVHAVSKQPPEKRGSALKEIKKRVDKARAKKAKLDTKDVKAIARTKKQPKLVGTTPKERKQADKFFSVLGSIGKTLAPYGEVLAKADERRRFVEVVFQQDRTAGERIKASVAVLTALYNELMRVYRERAIA